MNCARNFSKICFVPVRVIFNGGSDLKVTEIVEIVRVTIYYLHFIEDQF